MSRRFQALGRASPLDGRRHPHLYAFLEEAMTTILVLLALIGGGIGILALLFSDGVAGTHMVAIIALSCLAGILARIAQAADHREAMDKRLNALFKILEAREQ